MRMTELADLRRRIVQPELEAGAAPKTMRALKCTERLGEFYSSGLSVVCKVLYGHWLAHFSNSL